MLYSAPEVQRTLSELDLATPVNPDVEKRALQELGRLCSEVGFCWLTTNNVIPMQYYTHIHIHTYIYIYMYMYIFISVDLERVKTVALMRDRVQEPSTEVLSRCPEHLRRRDAELLRDRASLTALPRKEQQLEMQPTQGSCKRRMLSCSYMHLQYGTLKA